MREGRGGVGVVMRCKGDRSERERCWGDRVDRERCVWVTERG